MYIYIYIYIYDISRLRVKLNKMIDIEQCWYLEVRCESFI
jgi:hypothetical protein